MPPRFVYWTILIDNKPTAFRAREQADLVPTLTQLRRTNPDVTLKYFAHGKIWDSPEQARDALRPPVPTEKRGRDWRPGGTHEDPRARFDKAKRKKDQRGAPRSTDSPDKTTVPGSERRPWQDKRPSGGGAARSGRENRPWSAKPHGDRKPWQTKPSAPGAFKGSRDSQRPRLPSRDTRDSQRSRPPSAGESRGYVRSDRPKKDFRPRSSKPPMSISPRKAPPKKSEPEDE